MADVSRIRRSSGERRSRGQLVLVGGLVVAVALVALVLLLNTVLFAENLATRGPDPGGERASDHAAFAERSGAAVLRAEDRPATEPPDWQTARENVAADVDRVGALATNRSLQYHSAHTTLSVNDSTRGAALVQNASGSFTANGSEDWTLAETDGVRRFSTTVDAASMSPSESVAVAVDGNTDTWRAEVNATTAGGVRVSVDGGPTCTTSSTVATINWTEGTLDGCSFPFAVDGSGDALDGDLTLRFENGSAGHGTYFLVVADGDDDGDGDGDAVVDSNFDGPGSGQSPRWYPVVYSLWLDARYDDADVTYETTVRAAPGEPPQTSPAP